MQPYVASTPKIPIPFNRLLKIVAFVDASNRDVRLLLDLLEAERFEVEVRSDYGCDPAEDANVGGYIFDVDGPQLNKAREFGLALRQVGFRTPV